MVWNVVFVPGGGVAGLAVSVIVLQIEIIVFAVSIWQYDVIQLVDENAIMMYCKMLIIKLVILVYKQKYENRNCVHNE